MNSEENPKRGSEWDARGRNACKRLRFPAKKKQIHEGCVWFPPPIVSIEMTDQPFARNGSSLVSFEPDDQSSLNEMRKCIGIPIRHPDATV